MAAASILKRVYSHRKNECNHQESVKPSTYKAARCRVCLVKEHVDMPIVLIDKPARAYDLVKDELVSSDREILLSIMLATDLHLLGVETVAVGTINVCGATAAEIFRSAILANAAYIVLAHNHPSGNIQVSAEDVAFTDHVIRCGKLLNILVQDHLVVSSRGYVSMQEKDLISKS